jgi:hypothetical protein
VCVPCSAPEVFSALECVASITPIYHRSETGVGKSEKVCKIFAGADEREKIEKKGEKSRGGRHEKIGARQRGVQNRKNGA